MYCSKLALKGNSNRSKWYLWTDHDEALVLCAVCDIPASFTVYSYNESFVAVLPKKAIAPAVEVPAERRGVRRSDLTAMQELRQSYSGLQLRPYLFSLTRRTCCKCLLRQRKPASLFAQLGCEASQPAALAVQTTP